MSDNILGTLPTHILFSIFIKLPAEALIQLISVSKQFKSFICNPQFVEAHLSSVEPHPKHLLSFGPLEALVCNSHDNIRSNYSRKFIKHPFPLTWLSLRHIGTARGVVCMEDSENLMLWNPSIQKLKVVPKPVQNQIKFSECYGFGFDHVNVDFKVVRFSNNPERERADQEVMIYGEKSGHWKIVVTKVPCHVSPESRSVSVNGVAHWLLGQTIYKMGFDLVDEVFMTSVAQCCDLFLIDNREGPVTAQVVESNKWYCLFISKPFLYIDYTPSLALLLST